MKVVLLLFALMVPAYLLMCQRQTGPDSAEEGLPIYQNELNKAKGVEAMLKQGVDQRETKMHEQLEGADPR
jgi:outer membrane lipoprotein-sorting protein